MANHGADNMGRWTFEPTFAGTTTTDEIPMGHTEGGEHNSEPARVFTSGSEAPNLNGHVDGVGLDAGPPIEPVEHRHDPTLPLNSRDVWAFIVNKMIGTGIFIQPPALDEALPTPRLFAYTIYTFYFVFTYNTATNSMQLANQVLISANIRNPTFEPDGRLLRFIAVVALSFFCLLHYFSGHAGRKLNQVLAYFKVCLLLIVFFAGIVRASHHYTADWTKPSNPDRSSSATAFLLIVFSYTGWENATFVTGEIANHRILRNGFVSAILTVGVLYILVNVVFLLAVPYSVLIGPNAITAYVPLFFGGGLKAKLTWSILISISASGSLLSVIYTCARVKQVIGKSNVIPWSKWWRATSPDPPPRQRSEGRSERPTPKGGLILHWLFSVVLIAATSGMYDINEAIGFPGSLQAYASGWVGICIGIAFPFLFLKRDFLFMKARQIPLPTVRTWSQPGVSVLVRSRFGKGFFTFIYLGFNIYIVVVPLIGPYQDANGKNLEVKGWYYIVVMGCIVAAAMLYYFLAFGYGQQFDITRNIVYPKRTIVRAANALPLLHEDSVHDPQYGVRRWVEIEYVDPKPSYIYWLFGGSKREHYPNSTMVNSWNHLMGH
ncbi:hypothetical protein N431DRAFT_461088 [Stipitochalara longipes BDJ]|nr:hypothetical protein N431DRAFT_461088 [Stipitochalara longipes BDJ]